LRCPPSFCLTRLRNANTGSNPAESRHDCRLLPCLAEAPIRLCPEQRVKFVLAVPPEASSSGMPQQRVYSSGAMRSQSDPHRFWMWKFRKCGNFTRSIQSLPHRVYWCLLRVSLTDFRHSRHSGNVHRKPQATHRIRRNQRNGGSISQRMRHRLPRHRGKNVPAPVLVISKADAEHAPTTASIRRVVDEIGRPRQPDVTKITGLTSSQANSFVPGRPG